MLILLNAAGSDGVRSIAGEGSAEDFQRLVPALAGREIAGDRLLEMMIGQSGIGAEQGEQLGFAQPSIPNRNKIALQTRQIETPPMQSSLASSRDG